MTDAINVTFAPGYFTVCFLLPDGSPDDEKQFAACCPTLPSPGSLITHMGVEYRVPHPPMRVGPSGSPTVGNPVETYTEGNHNGAIYLVPVVSLAKA